MTYYRLVDYLRNVRKEQKNQFLFETTTIGDITYLPSQIGVVKTKILDLAKEKPEWGIKVLEKGNNKIVQIEDRLQITVSNEYWESFLKIFTEQDLNGKTLVLDFILQEAAEDDTKDLRRRLKTALVEMFNKQQFRSLDKIISVWIAEFGVTKYKTRGNKGPVVSYERKQKDIQKLYGDLLRVYGNDKGYLEMLLDDIKNTRFLNSYDVFRNYDFLYGTRILSYQDKVSLIFEALVDMTSTSIQSIYINNEEVLDEVEEKLKGVKRVKKVLYPKGIGFSSRFLRSLKDIIEDVVTED